jgi:hypothetical protein
MGHIDGRGVQNPAHRNDQVALGHVGFFDHQLEQAGAFLFLLLHQLLDLRARQQSVLDQGVGDAFTK